MIRLTIILMLLLASVIYSQSSIVYESGTEIEVTSGADICADDVTINGSYSGSGTQCDSPLPVELAYITGELDGEIVKLNWETATEINNYGFQVQRNTPLASGIPPYEGGNEGGWIELGFVQGYGTTNSPKQYSYEDDLDLTLNHNLNLSQLDYRLKQIDNDGTFTYSKVVTVDISTITSINEEEKNYTFKLAQNYPNPFNPSTVIKYQIPKRTHVRVEVFNSLAKRVAVLINREQNSGKYKVKFDGSGLSSGIYFYRLQTSERTDIKKMILVK